MWWYQVPLIGYPGNGNNSTNTSNGSSPGWNLPMPVTESPHRMNFSANISTTMWWYQVPLLGSPGNTNANTSNGSSPEWILTNHGENLTSLIGFERDVSDADDLPIDSDYIEMDLVVKNVNYSKLLANQSALEDFKAHVTGAIALESGPAVTADDIVLGIKEESPDSIAVSVTIWPDEGSILIHEVAAKMNTSNKMPETVARQISSMQNIEDLSSGAITVKRGSVSVVNAEVQTQSVPKTSSFKTASTTYNLRGHSDEVEASGAHTVNRYSVRAWCITIWLSCAFATRRG